MTEVQTTYRELIEELGNKENWQNKSDAYRVGNAGIALTVSFLTDGSLNLKHLKEQIPDFSQTELRSALANLKQNKFFTYDRKRKQHILSVDKDLSIEDGLFWALLSNVANGFINRVDA